MAEAYGVNSAKVYDTSVAPQNRSPVGGGDFGGRVRALYDKFTIPASGPGSAQDDTIVVGRIKKGQRVVGGTLSWTAAGSSVTLAWGVRGSGAIFRAATSGTTAGHGGFNSAGLGMGYLATADIDVLVTIAGAAPTTAAVIQSSLLVVDP